MKRTIVIFVLFALWGCTPLTEKKSPDHVEINNLLADYYKTMTDRNWEAYRQFFWPKATITTVWQKPDENEKSVSTSTIEEFVAQTHLGPDSQPIFEERMLDAEIKVKNNLAQAWVNYEAKFGSEENLMEWRGKDLFTFLQHDGKWKVVSLVFESDEN